MWLESQEEDEYFLKTVNGPHRSELTDGSS